MAASKRNKGKETKIISSFSIEPGDKQELEELFSDIGLDWSAGVRFALKLFIKNRKEEKKKI